MFRKQMGALILILLCFNLNMALAWAPEQFYESAADLPSEVQNKLPEKAKYVTGLRNGNTIVVTMLLSATSKEVGIFRKLENRWQLRCWSAPLSNAGTANVSIGASNQNRLYIFVNQYCYTFQEKEDGSWRLLYLQGEEDVEFVPNGCWLVADENKRHYGTVRWPSLDTLDLESLPKTYAQTCEMVDSKNWAVVHNPNPDDRLHLRTAAIQTAASLGKYYNGTPVQVLTQDGAWSKVEIAGVQGYMMNAYLDSSSNMDLVPQAFPGLYLSDDALRRGTEVYDAPSEEAKLVGKLTAFNGVSSQMFILGVVGEGWLHVCTISGLHGYVRSVFFRQGNG